MNNQQSLPLGYERDVLDLIFSIPSGLDNAQQVIKSGAWHWSAPSCVLAIGGCGLFFFKAQPPECSKNTHSRSTPLVTERAGSPFLWRSNYLPWIILKATSPFNHWGRNSSEAWLTAIVLTSVNIERLFDMNCCLEHPLSRSSYHEDLPLLKTVYTMQRLHRFWRWIKTEKNFSTWVGSVINLQ